ncbi:MAG: sugar ABC transporter permease [Oscillospiraceae bacterium]|nr:sugar ABC transporter permease [Ruminococcus sp.]MCD8344816.1 sugar ABC transporter permease [Oscillospiraceae bacterium]
MKKASSIRRNRILSNTAIYIILVVMSIVWLIPFVFILLQSFRCENTWMVGYVIPQQWGWDNYVNLFKETSFLQWYGNTLIIACFNAVLQTLMVMMMSYALSRLRFKGRKFLMNAMLVLGMFPGFLTMIILYYVLKGMGLTQEGAVPGLILVYFASSGMGYYVFKGFLDTIPKSLDEAARVDGATRFQVMRKVVLPLSKPIVIYTVLTAFMAPWADYIFASYIAFGTSSGYNVAVGLYSWLTKDMINSNYTLFCAGGVCIAIPITILFMCLQKYYVEGVTGGAVKG